MVLWASAGKWRRAVPLWAALSVLGPVLLPTVPAFAAESRLIHFHIRPQPLRDALLAFSEQAGVQLIVAPGTPKLRVRRGVRGDMDAHEALATLIEGTGLEFRFTGPITVVVRSAALAEDAGGKEAQQTASAETAARKEKSEPSSHVIWRDPTLIEEVVTVGTRTQGRTPVDTAVPVDVFGAEALHQNGYVETGRLLEALAPSFNFTETTISDGTDIVRPATLRGLGPDQVLILVNGKRRHSQAWVNVQNTVGKGSVGTDLGTIPVSAIKRVEILRDGAAAQYGSDAIAGVVNLILNDSADGMTATASWGQTYKGDGDSRYLSANVGLPLGKDVGYLNLTTEYRAQGATNRAGPSSLTGDVIMKIGDTDIDAFSMVWNGGIHAGGSGELYFFGSYADRKGLSGGFFRHPFQATRSVPQLYPDGFLPLQTTNVRDFSQAVGFKLNTDSGWDYDLSANFGSSSFAFGARNTVNVSLASAAYYTGGDPTTASPTEGYSGTLRFEQFTANFDAGGDINLGAWPGHFAYGLELRDETYRIQAGDTASYACGYVNGQLAPTILDPAQTAICGFQGFPGYSPEVAGDKSRTSYAAYADMELEPSEGTLLGFASRFENYPGTGSKLTGKLSLRLPITGRLAFRAAASTGFRAPALAQRAFSSVITNTGPSGLTQTLIAPEGHAFARAYGVNSLRHETSRNLSLGFVWSVGDNFTATLDAYRILIHDRIVLGPTLPVPGGISLGGIEAGSFFSNAVDTRTTGADFVANYRTLALAGALSLNASFSWNKTEITGINAPRGVTADVFFPTAERVNVEHGQPRFRATLSADYSKGRWGSVVRLNFYGDSESAFYTAYGNNIPADYAYSTLGLDRNKTIHSGTALIADAEISYAVSDRVSFAVGANNLFNTYPRKLPDHALARWISEGRKPGAFGNFIYPWVSMPWGIDGGYYYARMTVSF
ncbi:TonB-dependent receptor [Kordiimonas marina]|uniref:TonB-dependent receptor n=1 Tax=Kordiimonas marina TaxID=2872312 RepID=UPI001FF14096|nr:TonB-dependent receptor [Kordiimonas marina]MCJ9427718.1 TonB-dependent receptor [Kordiimonas marina]